MSKINFIIGGVQKAGTELISHYLRHHSEIMMPEKELHYFDTEISNNDLNFENYHKNFGNLKSNKLFGEISQLDITNPLRPLIFYKDHCSICVI